MPQGRQVARPWEPSHIVGESVASARLESDTGTTQPTGAGAAAPLPMVRPKPGALVVRSVVAGQKALLRVFGPVDAVTTPTLAEALRPYRRAGQSLILDLRSVEYIETPGLRLLMSLGEELQANSGEVRLVVRHPSRVERTLELVGLDRQFPVFSTPREAWQGPSGVATDPRPAAPGDLA